MPIVNPFQGQQFHVTSARHDFIRSLSVQQGGDDPGHVADSDIPFTRMVDAWLVAAALGRSENAFTLVGKGGIELRAVTALTVLNNHPGAVAFLMHLAVAHTGDCYVVQEPGEVIRIADGYAVAGVESLAELIGGPSGSRVMNLSRALSTRFNPQTGP